MGGNEHPIVALLGPTGSGKSRLAMDLAIALGGEIISCDALQVYRHMDIGTAKPTREERARVPHHMLDLRDPGQDFSAGDYQRLAREALSEISLRGRLPLLVGGTGFYFRALIDGLFEGPGRSDELRSRMRRIVDSRGAPSLHRALQRVDPQSAGRIMPTDASRIIRAYEVYFLTGKTMSWWQDQPRDALRGYRSLRLGISWPRDTLYQRINDRVEQMLQAGFVGEVKELLKQHPRSSQAFKAIGYRQIAAYLEGQCKLEQAVEEIQRESRRYAKRQLTWFHSDPQIVWLEASLGPEELAAQGLKLIRDFLERGHPDFPLSPDG